ncbi:aminotransferase class V-fold PLP-dependent enzyme, partial [Fulvivirga sp. RKSG066]|uniref:aminotransferase class V-fold PLP-dependent enzyme n=1 Tax=Fulvivirga aurantia TaxID=2529383 RepID=UPI0012BC028E
EIIASPMSCLASNQPLALLGAQIKWVDIDPNIGSLDPDEVKKNISSNTKAILLYHWGGYPGHIDEIVAIGQQFDIPVVEDAIESFGSEYKNKKVGNHGADFTLFSFQPVRLPTTIDGGGIVIRNSTLLDKALLMRDYGINRSNFRDSLGEINPECDISLPGMGATLNELGAYIGYTAMDYVPDLLKKQRNNAKVNKSVLDVYNEILHLSPKDALPNYWIYSFLTPKRDLLLK